MMQTSSRLSSQSDRIIFSDCLYDKQNNKLKKLKVELRESTNNDGKVFRLDIRGVRTFLQLDFCDQDVCFMKLEEVQDSVTHWGPSCFWCFQRNYFPQAVSSRLLLLLYAVSDSSDNGKCIKIPLYQPGNIHGAATLNRLRDCISTFVTKPEGMCHWSVTVRQCGDLYKGTQVFLCLTRYAVIIIRNEMILQYHSFHTSQITVGLGEEPNTFEVIVQDKEWHDTTSSHHSNFSLSRKYVFQTPDWQSIEKTFKSLMRKSELLPYSPRPHFNIHHSELSASIHPGTTSDNVQIIPHTFGLCENNNTSSSSSNGHVSAKIINVAGFNTPTAHLSSGPMTTSSNGSVPSSGSVLIPRCCNTSNQTLGNDKTVQPKNTKIDSAKSEIQRPNQLPIESDSKPESDPFGTKTDTLRRHRKTPSDPKFNKTASLHTFENIDLNLFPDLSEETQPKFLTEDELDLPLPPPCSATSQTHVKFEDYLLPPPNRCSNSSPSEDSGLNTPEHQTSRKILRSFSFMEINREGDMPQYYVNIAQESSFWGSVHDDSIYYRFYYNIWGKVWARMSKKIKRRGRLSREIKEVDFNKLENHERWYDRDFKVRDKDLKFCRLMNIEPDPTEKSYAVVDDKNDDPYWTQNELCVTLQLILQETPREMQIFNEIRDTFDLSADQLMSLQVQLSLVPADNNWKMLADFIGLSMSDVSIIEHFCYTYRELTSKIVLAHWMYQSRHGNMKDLPSSYENLNNFLHQYDRSDIISMIQSDKVNQSRQLTVDIIESTHF